MHYSAIRGIAIACRLSVCLSVPLVGYLANYNCTDNSLRNSKAIHLLPGKHVEIWGRQEMGWEKLACWNTEAAISLKRVKIEEKLLWRVTRQRSCEPPFPIRYGLLRLGFALRNLIQNFNHYYLRSQERAKLRLQIWPIYSQGPSEVPNKSPLKILRKLSVGVSRDPLPKFFWIPPRSLLVVYRGPYHTITILYLFTY